MQIVHRWKTNEDLSETVTTTIRARAFEFDEDVAGHSRDLLRAAPDRDCPGGLKCLRSC